VSVLRRSTRVLASGRVSRYAFVLARLLAGLTLAAAPIPASAADTQYRVVYATASQLERQLEEQGREGFACVGLAQPEPGSGTGGVVAIVARSSSAAPSVAAHRVIVGGRADMKVPLSQAGGEGFRLCGVVLDEEPPNPRDVAVMSRAAPGAWQYEAEVLLRYKESLARLNAIGRDGYVPVAAAAIDNNRVPDMRNWMVVAERPASGGDPREVTVRSDSGPTGLGRNLNDSGKQGYRVELIWKEGNDYVAMMTRPAGDSSTAHSYTVEADAPARMHFLPGLALADFPYLDRRLFVSDSAVRASNELVEEALPPLDARARAALGTIGDHVSRNHGFAVSYARVGRDKAGKLLLSVAMARKD
jgi:hypothetical protein